MSNLPSRFWLRSKDEPEVARAYVRRDLLTREEAANDPEVRRMIRDSIAAKWPLKGPSQDNVSGVTWDEEVTDDES